jgi:hypothetical protein
MPISDVAKPAADLISAPASDFLERFAGRLENPDTPSFPVLQLRYDLVGGGADQTIMPARSEEADDYHAIIARLNDSWRVIVCAADLQWILQRGDMARNHGDIRWRGRSYCRTSEALRRCTREDTGSVDPSALAILAALPERIDTNARFGMTLPKRARGRQSAGAEAAMRRESSDPFPGLDQTCRMVR